MRRHQARPMQDRQPSFDVGIDLGKILPHASVLDAEGTSCVPKVVACANIRDGYAPLYTLLAEATAQAAPAEVINGCEATAPDCLNRYAALTAPRRPAGGPRDWPCCGCCCGRSRLWSTCWQRWIGSSVVDLPAWTSICSRCRG